MGGAVVARGGGAYVRVGCMARHNTSSDSGQPTQKNRAVSLPSLRCSLGCHLSRGGVSTQCGHEEKGCLLGVDDDGLETLKGERSYMSIRD